RLESFGRTLAAKRRRSDAAAMPRRARDFAPGIFHVTTHSVRSTPLYMDDVDRMYFLTEFAATVVAYDWTCIEICLLATPYPALLETPDAALPVGMHRINHRHACRFNARHRLRGHVTHARYFSDRITSDGHLLAVYVYIAGNPVKAGLCERAEEWPWSSHAA